MEMFNISNLPQKELSNFINFSKHGDRIEVLIEGESLYMQEATFKNIETGLYFIINEIDYSSQEEFQKVYYGIKAIIKHKISL